MLLFLSFLELFLGPEALEFFPFIDGLHNIMELLHNFWGDLTQMSDVSDLLPPMLINHEIIHLRLVAN